MKICFVSTIYNHIFWPFLCYFFTAFIYFLVFMHHGVSFSQLELAYYKHHFFLKLAMCTECSRVMRFVRISQLSEIDIRLTIHYISRQPNTYIALDRLKKIKSAPPFLPFESVVLKMLFCQPKMASEICRIKSFLSLQEMFAYDLFTYMFTPQWHVWYRSVMNLKFPSYSTQNAYINFGNLQITNKNK